MSPGNPPSEPLTIEARKHLLLVACTIDRIDFTANVRRQSTLPRVLARLPQLPWLNVATSVALRLLPRRLRTLIRLGRWASRVWRTA